MKGIIQLFPSSSSSSSSSSSISVSNRSRTWKTITRYLQANNSKWNIQHKNNSGICGNSITNSSSSSLLGNNIQVPILDAKEMIVGKLLGEGNFCEVFEVHIMAHHGSSKKRRSRSRLPRGSSSSSHHHQGDGEAYALKRIKPTKKAVYCDQSSASIISSVTTTSTQSACCGQENTHRNTLTDLQNEAYLLSLCSHENIITIHATAAAASACEDYFLVLDRIQYTLLEKLNFWTSFQMEPSTLLEHNLHISLQLANALTYLHSKRIVYRDCKPENIGFQSNHSTIQLFDFGLSRELPDSTNTNDDDKECYHMSYAGSPMYMAPEVYTGCYNSKADVYSWSLVTYELLTFRKPYFETNDIETHRSLLLNMNLRPNLAHIPTIASDDDDDEKRVFSRLKQLLQQSWCTSLSRRLTMKEVSIELNRILLDKLHPSTSSSSSSL